MAQPCKVFSYTNVETEKDVLANIAAAAQAGGWSIDKNAALTDGEVYLHSAGNGSQNLYFSLRLLDAYNKADRFLLAVHGNTGFDGAAAWDAQPGRFTTTLEACYSAGSSGKPVWFKTAQAYTITSSGWWIVPPVAEQIVLVCPTFVLTAIRVVQTFSDGKNTPYAGWVPLFFGAADGPAGETQLNMVLWSAWSINCAMGLMLSALYVLPMSTTAQHYFAANNYGNIGILWKGSNVEGVPPVGPYGGYVSTPYASCVMRSSITSRPVIGGLSSSNMGLSGDIYGGGVTLTMSHKGKVCNSVPGYNTALLQNEGTLRHMLVKPILYACNGEDIRVMGELPYWAVNLHGLKPKDRIRIGSRVFMALPDISDNDTFGLAIEVEA